MMGHPPFDKDSLAAAASLAGTLEQIYNRVTPLVLGTDNSTAKLDLEVCWSKGLKHLRKHQRVSISLMNEALDKDDAFLLKSPTTENRSDLLTKALPSQTHWKHTLAFGLTMMDPVYEIVSSKL